MSRGQLTASSSAPPQLEHGTPPEFRFGQACRSGARLSARSGGCREKFVVDHCHCAIHQDEVELKPCVAGSRPEAAHAALHSSSSNSRIQERPAAIELQSSDPGESRPSSLLRKVCRKIFPALRSTSRRVGPPPRPSPTLSARVRG